MSRKQRGNFGQLILSYSLILILPCCVALFISFQTITLLKNNATQIRELQCVRRLDTVDDLCRSLNAYVYDISTNTSVQELLQMGTLEQIRDGQLIRLPEAITTTGIFSGTGRGIVTDTLLWFTKSGVLAHNGNVFKTSEWKHDYTVLGLTMNEWSQVTRQAADTRYIPLLIRSNEIETRTIAFVTLIGGLPTESHAALIILLSASNLERMLTDEDTAVCVIDAAGNILAGDPGVATGYDGEHGDSYTILLDGTEQRVSVKTSSYTGWTTLWAYPTSEVWQEIVPMAGLVAALAVLLLVATPVLCVWMAKRRNRPVQEIAGLLNTSETVSYDAIKQGVTRLLDRRRSLEQSLAQNRELVYATVMTRLLENRLTLGEQNRSLLCSFGLHTEEPVTVAVIRITGSTVESLEDQQIQLSVVSSVLTGAEDCVVHTMGTDKVVVLMYGGRVRERMEELYQELVSRGHTNLHIGVGRAAERLSEAARSYDEARVSSRTRSGGVAYYEEQPPAQSLWYPPEEERRLINVVRTGSTANAQEIVRRVLSRNESIGQPLTQMLEASLRLTLYKALSETSGTQTEIDTLLSELAENAEDTDVVRLCTRACACFMTERRDRSSAVVRGVVGYIEQMYADPEITLGSTAVRFDISEAYLSHQFKELTGENFAACLERIRLNSAHTWLEKSELPIDDVARNCGYASANTFRKAFKRFHGITPQEYRNSLRTSV